MRCGSGFRWRVRSDEFCAKKGLFGGFYLLTR